MDLAPKSTLSQTLALTLPASPTSDRYALWEREQVLRRAAATPDAPDFDELPPVATTIPKISEEEFRRFRVAMPNEPLLASYETWLAHIAEAMATSENLRRVVPIMVTRGGWEGWRKRHPERRGLESLRACANDRFNQKARDLRLGAKEMSDDVPTQKLHRRRHGTNRRRCRNDISQIASMRQRSNARPEMRRLVTDARISHQQGPEVLPRLTPSRKAPMQFSGGTICVTRGHEYC